MPESKTSPRRLQAIQRQKDALNLRIAGSSYEEIARALGYRDKSGAYQAIMSALKRTLQEPADQVRTLHLERLNRLLLACWPEATNQKNLKAIDRALKVLDQMAEIQGLKAEREGEDIGDAMAAILARFLGSDSGQHRDSRGLDNQMAGQDATHRPTELAQETQAPNQD